MSDETTPSELQAMQVRLRVAEQTLRIQSHQLDYLEETVEQLQTRLRQLETAQQPVADASGATVSLSVPPVDKPAVAAVVAAAPVNSPLVKALQPPPWQVPAEPVPTPVSPARAVVVPPVSTPLSTPVPQSLPELPELSLPTWQAGHEWLPRWLVEGNLLVKGGVLFLFLGLSFLLRYASEHVAFPVWLRYVVVAAAGGGLLLMGWRLFRRQQADTTDDNRRSYALLLQGGGIAVLYLSTFAALRLHELLPPQLAFVLMLAVAVLAAVLALRQDALPLAVVGTLGGFATPVLASTGHGSAQALFAYLLLLNLGIFALAWFKTWRPLNLLGFGGTVLLASLWAERSYTPALYGVCQGFLLVFFLLYVAILLLFAHRSQAAQTASPGLGDWRQVLAVSDYVDGSLAFGVPLSAFGLQYGLVRDWEYGPVWAALAYAGFYLVLAAVIRRHRGERDRLLIETFLALGLIFGTLAIPLGLDAEWTASAWAVEAAGVFWLGLRQSQWTGNWQAHWLSRSFARLVLLAAAFSGFVALDWGSWFSFGHVSGVLLPGPRLGTALIALAAVFCLWLGHRPLPNQTSKPDQSPAYGHFLALEQALDGLLPWIAVVFATLLPMLFYRESGVTLCWAGLAVLSLLAGQVWQIGLFRRWAGLLHGLLGLMVHTAFEQIPDTVSVAPWVQALGLALSAYACGWLLYREYCRKTAAGVPIPRQQWLVLGWASLWWARGLLQLVDEHCLPDWQQAALLLLAAGSAILWQWLAVRLRWRPLGLLGLTLLPVFLLLALAAIGEDAHPVAGDPALLAWPLAFVTYFWCLWRLETSNRVDGASDSSRWPLTHVFGAILVVLLLMLEGHYRFGLLDAADPAWALLGTILPAVGFFALLATPVLQVRWPLQRWVQAYQQQATQAVLWISACWLLWANTLAAGTQGSSLPLPWFPLLNPLELGCLLWLLAQYRWWQHLPEAVANQDWSGFKLLLGGEAFVLLTGTILRTLHHGFAVPWTLDGMLLSPLAQGTLSVVWALVALVLMLAGHRQTRRWLWLVGAGLMALVAIKLFALDLSRVGSLARIVSFIVVGVLLLVVGYFAPVPPKENLPKA
jgi:uncharacterized membrane protein